MNRISPRQILLFLACVAPIGKLIVLPAQLTDAAQNDLLFPLALHIALQACAVFCVLLAAKREESAYSLLSSVIGKIGAKIFLTVFALFLLYAGLLPLLEQKLFVQTVFYDTLPSFVAFAPFFLFAAYLCAKPISSYGRIWDAIAPVAAVGLFGVLLLSVSGADFAALLPVGAGGLDGFWKGVQRGSGWFFDAALLIPLLGKIQYKKGLAWKGALCYGLGGIAALFFTAVFFGIFQETGVNQLFAFTATSKYFSGVSTLGRIDYLFIFALALVLAFYLALPLHGCAECLLEAYGKHKFLPVLLGVGVSALMLLLSYLLDYRFTEVLPVIAGTLFWIFPVFCLLVPAVFPIIERSSRADP